MRNEGLVSTTSAVDDTVPEETSESAVARERTLKDTVPDGVPEAAVAVTAEVSEDVASRAPHPFAVESACAAVWKVRRSLLMD
jgi:hypothetical protein